MCQGTSITQADQSLGYQLHDVVASASNQTSKPLVQYMIEGAKFVRDNTEVVLKKAVEYAKSTLVPAQPALQNVQPYSNVSVRVENLTCNVTINFNNGSQGTMANAPPVDVENLTLNVANNFNNGAQGTMANAPPGITAQTALVSSTPTTRDHEHSLILTKDNNNSIYKCSECKEPAMGDRYICQHCSYVRHPNCMNYPKKATHKFFEKSTFSFHEESFDNKVRHCDACSLDVNRLFYHCEKTNKDMHPICLNMPEILHIDGRNLNLCKKMTAKCSHCVSGKKDYKKQYWCYSSKKKDWQCHVSCMIEALKV